MENTYRVANWGANYENNRTRELKKLEWVPVPNKMDGAGYTELVDHPNGAAHFGAWIAILEIASRQTVRGVIPQASAGIAQALARISRLPLSVFQEVLPRLELIGWIEPIPGRVAEKIQQIQPLDEIPHDGAEIPQASAGIPALKGMELKGTEGNGKTLSPPADAGVGEANPSMDLVRTVGSWFEREFWPAWPVKENKPPAVKAAKKISPSEYAAVMDGLLRQRSRILSMDRPIHAATWLNNRRWEDESLLHFSEKPPARQSFVESVEAHMQGRVRRGLSPL